MSFLFPGFLWGLTALIPLALVYLIKVHPVRKKTSAWFLWEGIFQERRAASLLQKLRDWLSLLLMLLAFICLVLALAQPVLDKGAAAERVVLIVDNSLSMNADGRLDEAQRAAQSVVRSLPTGGRAAVFSLSEALVSESGFTSSRRELLHGIDAVEVSDAPFNVHALKHFFRDEAMAEKQRVLLFTDGCFEGLDGLPDSIEVVKIGAPEKNVGIAAFDVRRIPGADQPVGVFFRLFSGHSEPVEVDAVLCHETEDDVRRVFSLTLQPGLNEPEMVNLPSGDTGRWILMLEHEDALERDNTAYAVVPEVDPVRVAVRAPETQVFWQLCVEAFGEGVNGLMMTEQNPELELYRGAVSEAAASRLAVFAPTGKSPFWNRISGEEREATVRVLLSEHPLVKYADLDGLLVQGVRDVVPPDQAVIVAETDDGIPLIYKTTQGEQSAYVLNFDPAQNNFFLHPLYPVLVWSVASELMDLAEELPSAVTSGAMVQLPPGFVEGDVTPPGGETLRFADSRIGPLTEFGFYTVVSGENRMSVACSTAPTAESQLDNAPVKSAETFHAAGFPLAEWFMAAGLILMALECILYHRRKVG
ncbi:MAG: BatA and WFA domain-containing protein [Pontiellaceae bacterium]|nr:BatA and WFA domain-containing protein [Pontiellaceae bacterium]